MSRFSQRGASTLLILLIMVLLLVAFFAAWTVSRITGSGDDRTETDKRLNAAAAALERYAASNQRLPCPADPSAAAVTPGAEVKATAATCSFDTGTLPWLTLGLTSDAGLDAWGRKLSYRVYTGNKGSFTQPGGVSMVECDTVEPTIGSATNVAASLGGLCVSNADPYQRTTTPDKFLFGKGLTVIDRGTTHADVAYVVISHGASGLGAWTIAGTQLASPNSSDEKNNMKDTGSFTIKAFSGADIEVVNPQHFDDQLVYATIGDLVKRAGLQARDWPDTATSSVTFDATTVAAALGQPSVTPGDQGATTLDFGSARVTGYTGTTATNISYDTNSAGTPVGGIGVAGNAITGFGFANMISSLSGEFLSITLSQAGAKFAVTLNEFGIYNFSGSTYTEQAQFKFYLGTTLVDTITKAGCNTDGGLASFSMTPAGVFDKVEVIPVAATRAGGGTLVSLFLLSEIKACTASTSNCKTSLTTGANTCP